MSVHSRSKRYAEHPHITSSMKFTTALLILLAIAAPPLEAQATAEELSRCSRINTVPAKLACYEGLARKSAGAEVAEAPAERDSTTRIVGSWRVTDQVDPISDRKGAIFQLPAEPTSRTVFTPALVIRCVRGQLELFVNSGAWLGFDAQRITLRFDTNPPRTATWSTSSNYRSVFFPGNRRALEDFLQQLAASERLTVQVTPSNETPLPLVFPLAGVSEVVAEALELCPR